MKVTNSGAGDELVNMSQQVAKNAKSPDASSVQNTPAFIREMPLDGVLKAAMEQLLKMMNQRTSLLEQLPPELKTAVKNMLQENFSSDQLLNSGLAKMVTAQTASSQLLAQVIQTLNEQAAATVFTPDTSPVPKPQDSSRNVNQQPFSGNLDDVSQPAQDTSEFLPKAADTSGNPMPEKLAGSQTSEDKVRQQLPLEQSLPEQAAAKPQVIIKDQTIAKEQSAAAVLPSEENLDNQTIEMPEPFQTTVPNKEVKPNADKGVLAQIPQRIKEEAENTNNVKADQANVITSPSSKQATVPAERTTKTIMEQRLAGFPQEGSQPPENSKSLQTVQQGKTLLQLQADEMPAPALDTAADTLAEPRTKLAPEAGILQNFAKEPELENLLKATILSPKNDMGQTFPEKTNQSSGTANLLADTAQKEWKELPSEKQTKIVQVLQELKATYAAAESRTDAPTVAKNSLVMSFPLYFEDNPSAYPAYLHIYRETEQENSSSEYQQQRDLWLRICMLTENLGPVDTVFRLRQKQNLDIRITAPKEQLPSFEAGELKKILADFPFSLDSVIFRKG